MSKKVFKVTYCVTTWTETEVVADNLVEAQLLAAEEGMRQRDLRKQSDPDVEITVSAVVESAGSAREFDHEI